MFILMSVCDFPFPLFESKPEYVCLFGSLMVGCLAIFALFKGT